MTIQEQLVTERAIGVSNPHISAAERAGMLILDKEIVVSGDLTAADLSHLNWEAEKLLGQTIKDPHAYGPVDAIERQDAVGTSTDVQSEILRGINRMAELCVGLIYERNGDARIAEQSEFVSTFLESVAASERYANRVVYDPYDSVYFAAVCPVSEAAPEGRTRPEIVARIGALTNWQKPDQPGLKTYFIQSRLRGDVPGKVISLYMVEGQKPELREEGWQGGEYVETLIDPKTEQQYFTALFSDMAMAIALQRPEDDCNARIAAISRRIIA